MPAPHGFTWIKRPLLAALARPGDAADLAWLRRHGIQVLLSLTEEPMRRDWVNDAGLMLQAAEQNLGLALARELLAADALRDGRLVKLSPLAVTHEMAQPYHLVYPPNLRDWPPLNALRKWLYEELQLSRKALHPAAPARRTRAKRR